MVTFKRLLTFYLLFGQFAEGYSQQDASGLQVSAAVDIAGEFAADRDTLSKDKAEVRKGEFILLSPIDHVFRGQLAFAAHQEGGESVLEVHEAFIASSVLIPRSNIRFGQYFLGIGRLNRFHQHEWPMIEAPIVHERFFDKEGLVDTGLEFSSVLPVGFYLDLTLGVTNGFVYGHAHTEGEKPRQPTHYARMSSSLTLPGGGVSQLGITFLSRTDQERMRMAIVGSDFTAKWRSGRTLDFLLQGEVYQRTVSYPSLRSERNLGAYLIPQAALGYKHFGGILLDYYTNLSLEDASGQATENAIIGWTPTYTMKVSEFSTLRLAYQTYRDVQEGRANRFSRQWLFQATYTIGAHPAHDF